MTDRKAEAAAAGQPVVLHLTILHVPGEPLPGATLNALAQAIARLDPDDPAFERERSRIAAVLWRLASRMEATEVEAER